MKPTRMTRSAGLLLFAGLPLAAVLTGCGLGLTSAAGGGAGGSAQGLKISGNVHGGQQPVGGAAVYFYAASTSGYGAPSTSLLNTAASGVMIDGLGQGFVLSDANGNFSIRNDYTCPSPTAQVYLLAVGGNPGLATVTLNGSLAMMAALGNCGGLSSSTFIQINEVTTVAAVWALAPFMLDGENIGTSPTNVAGLAAAFTGAAQLANVGSGSASGPALPAGGVVSVAEVNTLANIIAACVNTAGGVAGDGSICGNLLTAATPYSTTPPQDTLGALLYVAHNPAHNVATLFNMATGIAPFQPTLPTAPTDWTIAVQYKAAGLSTPKALALDANGNVWIANCGSISCSVAGTGSVTELTNSGAIIGTTTAGGLNIPSAIAIDLTGNAWVANAGNNSVTELSAANMSPVAPAYTGGGLNVPNSIAVDSLGQSWITNAGSGTVTVLSSTGAALTPSSGYSGVSVPSPVGILINPH